MSEIAGLLRRVATPGHVQLDTTFNIFLSLLISGLLVSIVAKLYLKFYRGLGRPQSTAMTMILVAMVTSSIIMAIGGNLALSLGMVGALSIIRYRTAVKDMRDLAYLFWAIAIGLCCGAGSYRLVFIMTGTIAVVVTALEILRLHEPNLREYILIVQSDPSLSNAELMEAVPGGLQLKSSAVAKAGKAQESTFVVNLGTGRDHRTELEKHLKGMEGVKGYQLLSPNHEVLG